MRPLAGAVADGYSRASVRSLTGTIVLVPWPMMLPLMCTVAHQFGRRWVRSFRYRGQWVSLEGTVAHQFGRRWVSLLGIVAHRCGRRFRDELNTQGVSHVTHACSPGFQ